MRDEVQQSPPAPPDPMLRARRWLALAVGLTALGYTAYMVARGLRETGAELAAFRWGLYAPVLLLTLVNYGLRYAKWHYLLGRLGVRIDHATNARIFLAGLAMVISPAKAGELIKPWLVREATGAPMARTIPALVTERVTDGLAVVALTALGVGTWYADGVPLVVATGAAVLLGLGVVASPRLSNALIDLVERAPVVGRFAGKLREMYGAMRVCTAPGPLLVTMSLSLVAWWAECVGYWLVLRGFEVEAGLSLSTFLYAFATVFGAPSPGGMGMADAALVEGAVALAEGITGPKAVAAALLIRIATLWFGVLLGAVAILRMGDSKRAPGARGPA